MALDGGPSSLTDALGQAPQLYLSVLAGGVPIVTPELYSVAGDRLWCLTARSTAKARLTDDGDHVGVAAMTAQHSAVLRCTIERFDPAHPAALMAKLSELGEAAAGLMTFLSRNGIEMVGAARDAVLGRMGKVPDARMLFALDPLDSFVLSGDDSPRATTVVGWLAGGKPLALPAQWSDDDHVARMPAVLFDRFKADASGPATLCFDEWSGTGPSGKQGMVLRGQGTSERDGDTVVLSLDVDRVTSWDGVEVTHSN